MIELPFTFRTAGTAGKNCLLARSIFICTISIEASCLFVHIRYLISCIHTISKINIFIVNICKHKIFDYLYAYDKQRQYIYLYDIYLGVVSICKHKIPDYLYAYDIKR